MTLLQRFAILALLASGQLAHAAGTLASDLTVQRTLSLTGDISPSQITANQNNYAPTNHATAGILRISSDAARSITGLAGGAEGRILVIANVGSFAITLSDESASSTAANRFALTPGDVAIAPDAIVTLVYDSTSSRWRMGTTGGGIAGVAGGGTGVSTFGGTNRILYTPTTDTLSSIATANSSIFITNGSGVPSWSTTLPSHTVGGVLTLAAAGASNPLLKIQPTSGAASALLQIPSTADFADVTFYDQAGTYRGYIEYMGSAYGTVGRRNNLEIGTNGSSGDITIRPNETEVARYFGSGRIGFGSATDDGVNFFQVTGATKVTGTFAATGVLTAGSGPTTLTDSAGKILSAALNTVGVAQGGSGAVTLTGLLLGNGTSAFTAVTTSAGISGAISDETGSGVAVFATSPALVTPSLGVATATSINGNTLTTGTWTLTGAASKTLTFSNTITLAGTDGQTYTFPSTSATIARTDAANTFTGTQTISTLRSAAGSALSIGTGTTGEAISIASATNLVTVNQRLEVFVNRGVSGDNFKASPNGNGDNQPWGFIVGANAAGMGGGLLAYTHTDPVWAGQVRYYADAWLVLQGGANAGGTARVSGYLLTTEAWRTSGSTLSTGSHSIYYTNSATTSTNGSLVIGNGTGATTIGMGGGNGFFGGTLNAGSTTEATTGGAGAITTPGGIFATKKIITGSTLTTAAGVAFDFGGYTAGAPTPDGYFTFVAGGATYRVSVDLQ